LRSSGPFTEKKFREKDVATALAKRVLPVPGGPKSKTPGIVIGKKDGRVSDEYLIASSSHQRRLRDAARAVE
jgi:hypothetical protein